MWWLVLACRSAPDTSGATTDTSSATSSGETSGPTTPPDVCGPMDHLVHWAGAIPESMDAEPDGAWLGGTFSGSIDGGPGNPALESPNGSSGMLLRLAADGSTVWARAARSRLVNTATVRVHGDRVAWWTVRLQADVTFDGGSHPGVHLPKHGIEDVAVAMYTTAGDLSWVADVGGDGDKNPIDLAIAADGSVYAVGTYGLSPAVFDPGGASFSLAYDPRNDDCCLYKDGFLAKWNADGSFAWASSFTGNNNQTPGTVSVLEDGTVIVAGSYHDDLDITSPSSHVVLPGIPDSLGFTAAFSPEGRSLWTQRWGNASHASAAQVTCGGSTGTTAVMVGVVDEEASFGADWPAHVYPVPLGYAMVGWSSTGDIRFVRGMNFSNGPFSSDVDSLGYITVGGTVAGPFTFGAQPNQVALDPWVDGNREGDPGVFVWAPDGTELCTWPLQSDAGDLQHAAAVAFDGVGGVWASGLFEDHLTLVPGTPEESTITAGPGGDTWIAHFLLPPASRQGR